MCSSTFDAHGRDKDLFGLFGPTRNRVPIYRLIQEKCGYLPRLQLLPIVGSLDGLLALLRTAFEHIIKVCTNNMNKYQYHHKNNSQSMKSTDSTREILTIEPRA